MIAPFSSELLGLANHGSNPVDLLIGSHGRVVQAVVFDMVLRCTKTTTSAMAEATNNKIKVPKSAMNRKQSLASLW